MNSVPLSSRLDFSTPGTVFVHTGKVEIGQGILAAFAQIAANALGLSHEQVSVAPTTTGTSPDEGHTAGSLSIQTSGMAIEQACLQARAAVIEAAAATLNVSPDVITIANGGIFCRGAATGLDYWRYADLLANVVIDADHALRSPESSIARELPRGDLAARISGRGFIHDYRLEGMLHARVARPAAHGATLEKLDSAAFLAANPGLELLVDGDFIAVIGTLEEDAIRGAERVRSYIEWRVPGESNPLGEVIDWLPREPLAPPYDNLGSPPGRHVAVYSRPATLHGSIGTACAIARFANGRLEVWSHSQNIFALRDAIAKLLELGPAHVVITHAPGAGCYGHNGADDAAFDAALISTRFEGSPVRVQWSREEELAWSPAGAPMVVRIDAALADDGKISAWELALWTAPHARRPGMDGEPNLLSGTMLAKPTPLGRPREIPGIFGGGGNRNAIAIYDLPSPRLVEHFIDDLAIRTSSLRALGAHLNVFAIESMMDELAGHAGCDPLEFRLRHLSDPLARRVLEHAASMSGWGTQSDGASAQGIAVARYKNVGGYAAIVAQVAVDEEVVVQDIWCAVDVGRVISRDGLLNQIEGGIVQSISWALLEAAPLSARGVEARSWRDYPILRFSASPTIHVALVGGDGDPPVGGGEIVQGPATAAVGNAASAFLGLRLRHLPLTRDRIIAGVMAQNIG